MSGIFGIMNSSDACDVASSLKKLQKWNGVFGETKETKAVSGFFGLGICADHITNAPINKTPVLNKEEKTGVIDALIYNRKELSESFDLSSSFSDEEMLFELVCKSGPEHLKYVNGDFSGAIYDEKEQKLLLFTDHMGVHPLFYYRSPSMASFSTELRGLINLPEIPGHINPKYLYATVCGYINSSIHETEFEDIYTVTPASYLYVTKKGNELDYEEHKYWALGEHKVKLSSNKKYFEKMRELVTASIKRRLDVFPDVVGAELSGGLDSSVIDILINRLGRKGVYYSWSFDPKDLPLVPNDERLVIEDICKQENITCNYRSREYYKNNSNIIENHLKLGFSKDAPGDFAFKFAYPLYTNTEIICEASQLVSSKGAKVVFSGHGGDEGVSHRCDPYELYHAGEKLHFIHCLWEFNEGTKNRALKTFRDYRYKAARGYSYENDPAIGSAYSAPSILNDSFKAKYSDYKGAPYYFPFDVLKYIGTGATNVRLNVAALFGPYSGARYVFPFLDREVIDFAVSIPRHLYIKRKQKRYIYRQAFKDLMPKSLADVTYKDTPSENKEHDNSDWFKDANRCANDLYNLLDRDYWGQYLDYDFLASLKDAQEPTKQEEITAYTAATNHLTSLYYFQHLVETVKML
jgi:asparagine synthase (glutamine-hydrolysing)